MRLNRRVRNRTHGGVRGRGYLAPPTRLDWKEEAAKYPVRLLTAQTEHPW